MKVVSSLESIVEDLKALPPARLELAADFVNRKKPTSWNGSSRNVRGSMKTLGGLLLDTNVVVAHFRNDRDLTARLRTIRAIYVPWVVLGELHYGALRAQRRKAQLALIRDFMVTATLLLPDRSTSEWYGRVKEELAAMGKLIPENDIWIAATARQFDLPLATRDAHFANVIGLERIAW